MNSPKPPASRSCSVQILRLECGVYLRRRTVAVTIIGE